MEARKKLRKMLSENRTAWYAGAYDALSAKFVQDAGFDAVFTSGFAVSASLLGEPDLALYSMTENLEVARRVASSVTIPVGVDCDTGYGNALNVMRTVREFENAGASAIILEDQVTPKRCPMVFDRVETVPLEEAVGKIKAAVAARQDADLVIIARTDATTISEAIVRCKAYRDAGADLVKGISKTFQNAADLHRLRQEVGLPLHLSLLGWLETGLSREEIEHLGGFAGFPFVGLMSAAYALRENLAALAVRKSPAELPQGRMTAEELADVLGRRKYERLQHEYLPIAG